MSKSKNSNKIRVGVMAPSFVVPKIEFGLGVSRLQDLGFDVNTAKQVFFKKDFYAGSDWDQASALIKFAYDSKTQVIWAARGGSGAIRILPFLDEWTKKNGKPPKKVFVGYSDSSILLWYLAHYWGWSVVHAPMPSLREFSILNDKQMGSVVATVKQAVKQDSKNLPSPGFKFLCGAKPKKINAPILGGNLTTLCSLAGTKWGFVPDKKYVLFLEDVAEAAYRIDRLVLQLEHSGAFKHCVAIILGTWSGCHDQVAQVLKRVPKDLKNILPKDLMPLRKPISSQEDFLKTIFEPIAVKHKIPVFYGFPAGHGKDGHQAIEFGKKVTIIGASSK